MENKNLPAFPEQELDTKNSLVGKPVYKAFGGLTKREYFAAMAMQGLLATGSGSVNINSANVAHKSIQLADELLNQLEKQ